MVCWRLVFYYKIKSPQNIQGGDGVGGAGFIYISLKGDAITKPQFIYL